MSRRLGTSVSEAARLVNYLQPAVLSTSAALLHSECMQVKPAVDAMALGQRVINEKRFRSLSHFVKRNRRKTVARLTNHYKGVPSKILSERTVQRPLLDMKLRRRYPIQLPLLTKRHPQLLLHWTQEHRQWIMDQWRDLPARRNHYFSFIRWMAVSGYTAVSGTRGGGRTDRKILTSFRTCCTLTWRTFITVNGSSSRTIIHVTRLELFWSEMSEFNNGRNSRNIILNSS